MKYFLRRLGFYLFTLWAAITINFFIPRMIPGNAVDSLLAQRRGEVDSQAVQSLNILFGLDKHQSLASQYWDYLVQLSHGDLGISFHNFPKPVTTVLGSALPWTLGLVGTTAILAFLIGTALGVFVGWKRGTWLDSPGAGHQLHLVDPVLLVRADRHRRCSPRAAGFPTSGGYDPGMEPGLERSFIGSALNHSILPALTIVVSSIGGWLLGMRNMMVTSPPRTTSASRTPRACPSAGS